MALGRKPQRPVILKKIHLKIRHTRYLPGCYWMQTHYKHNKEHVAVCSPSSGTSPARFWDDFWADGRQTPGSEEHILAFRSHLFLLLPAHDFSLTSGKVAYHRQSEHRCLWQARLTVPVRSAPRASFLGDSSLTKERNGSKSYMTHLFLSSIY